MELARTRPDVGAVTVDHERKVPEDADRPALLPRVGPLTVGNPLQVLVVADGRAEPQPSRVEHVRLAIAQRRFPLAPVVTAVLVVKRAEERVGIEPPCFARDVSAEVTRAFGAAAQIVRQEAIARHTKGVVFHGAHRRILNPRRRAGLRDRSALRRRAPGVRPHSGNPPSARRR